MSILHHILDVTNRHWAQAERIKGLVAKPTKDCVEFFIVTAQDVAHIPRFHDRKVGAGFIIGLEGYEIEGVRCLKSFNIGDVIIRDPSNHADMKVIHRKIFDSIYEPGA